MAAACGACPSRSTPRSPTAFPFPARTVHGSPMCVSTPPVARACHSSTSTPGRTRPARSPADGSGRRRTGAADRPRNCWRIATAASTPTAPSTACCASVVARARWKQSRCSWTASGCPARQVPSTRSFPTRARRAGPQAPSASAGATARRRAARVTRWGCSISAPGRCGCARSAGARTAAHRAWSPTMARP